MEAFKQLLTNYAYNITGSYEDARDVVQDVYLEVLNKDEEKIEDKKAYLTRSVINRAINWKKRQQKFVSEYPGRWLPEPVATEAADTLVEQKDILNYSLLVLLEKLNARQRAVFILKEAFEYDHQEIAQLLSITEENSRKILSRAKKELTNHSLVEPPIISSDYLQQYIEVIHNRDMDKLEKLLAEEVSLVSDGGGKAPAAINPLFGKKAVMAFIVGNYHKFYQHTRIEPFEVNHQPALLYYQQGQLVTCQIFIVQNGYIENMYFIRNPDKLQAIKKITG